MNTQEQRRFAILRQGPCVPFAYLRDHYGITWSPPDNDLQHDFEKWRELRKRRDQCAEGSISRYEIEAFMQEKSVLPKKWMAARLGMKEASLDRLLERLPEIGMRPQRYVVYRELIARTLSKDIVSSLPSLEFLTFWDHNSFCERVHEELHNVLDIQIEPLFCETSIRIQDEPKQYASDFDCITLKPISGRHQMWLDFDKPLNLDTDRCSRLLYAENHEELSPFRAGTREPDDLNWYEPFRAGANHASDSVVLG